MVFIMFLSVKEFYGDILYRIHFILYIIAVKKYIETDNNRDAYKNNNSNKVIITKLERISVLKSPR